MNENNLSENIKRRVSLKAKGIRWKTFSINNGEELSQILKEKIILSYWDSLTKEMKNNLISSIQTHFNIKKKRIASILQDESIFEYIWDTIPEEEKQQLFETFVSSQQQELGKSTLPNFINLIFRQFEQERDENHHEYTNRVHQETGKLGKIFIYLRDSKLGLKKMVYFPNEEIFTEDSLIQLRDLNLRRLEILKLLINHYSSFRGFFFNSIEELSEIIERDFREFS